MITDQVGDLTLPLINIYNEKDETKKVLRNLMSVSVPYSVCQALFETANQSVFFLKIGFQSTLRDIREFEQRSIVSYARKSEVNFLQCWFSPKQSSNFAIECDVINRWIIGIRNKYQVPGAIGIVPPPPLDFLECWFVTFNKISSRSSLSE